MALASNFLASFYFVLSLVVISQAAIWQPRPRTTWNIQLQGTVKASKVNTSSFDLDLFDTPNATIDTLHSQGKKVICYFSAGSGEDWRPDYNRIPPSALGNDLDGWPGERWLDIRNPGVLSVMKSRMDLAKAKGCDAVDPDNVDGYANDNGFGLSSADQIKFNRQLALEAHNRNLVVGLKNDLDQVNDLVSYFDFAVNEQCLVYRECDKLLPFVRNNKAVFELEYEYTGTFAQMCQTAMRNNFTMLYKSEALDTTDARFC